MSRHKSLRQRTRPNHERWLVSYADFITLLFAFFVVLYASSQGDQKKAARLANAIEAAFQELGMGTSPTSAREPAAQEISVVSAQEDLAMREQVARIPRQMTTEEIGDLSRQVARSLLPEISRGEVKIRTTPDGLVVSLQEIGFFESGAATLRSDSQDAIARIAAVLNDRGCNVRIEGHTDNVPIHTAQFDSNWELSTARATGLVKLLVQKYGVDSEALAAGGYGEFHPIATNDTAEGRRANRQVDLVILSAVVRVRSASGTGFPPSPI